MNNFQVLGLLKRSRVHKIQNGYLDIESLMLLFDFILGEWNYEPKGKLGKSSFYVAYK